MTEEQKKSGVNIGEAVEPTSSSLKEEQIYQNIGIDFEHNNLGPKKEYGPLSIIALGYVVCDSWVGLGVTLTIGIAQGGFMTIIYGTIIIFVLMGSSALSMAELASVYPTAGGQYHWTSIVSPKGSSKSLSYLCACINICAWIFTVSSIALIITEYVSTLVTSYNPDKVLTSWQEFLIYQLVNLISLAYNAFLARKMAWFNHVVFLLSIVSFFVTLIVCLSRTDSHLDTTTVWTTFMNSTGWTNNGIVFMTGLLNPAFMYNGLDSAVHLAEECIHPNRAVPRALVSTILVGFVTAFIYPITMAYSISDLDEILEIGSAIPLYDIWVQASNSKAFGLFFMIILFIVTLGAMTAASTTASRLTWSFARDNGLLCSSYLGYVNPKFEVPLWSIFFNSFLVFVCGCIYLASSTVFNALIACALIFMQVSFAMPAAVLLYQKRSEQYLPTSRYFNLGGFGWVVNIITVLTAIIFLVFFNFPVEMPAVGSNMNYASAVCGVVILLVSLNWFFHARKKFKGPRIVLYE
ncbi:hypothetical protein TRICI_004089 [Trichomonascus ciferrii]|uniref:Amino acid permease/ SLC12A domain-containing protein n=1 Tax=Trichomonascus ciferrii TaxID=44093 RepID=A0A642V1Y0_9ASCO|nr:hypothetical protein TRICI_004089 [Trichomonascus ciferrii]